MRHVGRIELSAAKILGLFAVRADSAFLSESAVHVDLGLHGVGAFAAGPLVQDFRAVGVEGVNFVYCERMRRLVRKVSG